LNRAAASFSAIMLVSGVVLFSSAPHDWKDRVPARERMRTNPLPEDKATIDRGAEIYAERCASCHGVDALGKGHRPGLRTGRVREATDGELFWLLENGNLRRGMPSWSALPEPQRWQVERYVRSLPEAGGR
jgi:mono/diheme cytochrome c family protein